MTISPVVNSTTDQRSVYYRDRRLNVTAHGTLRTNTCFLAEIKVCKILMDIGIDKQIQDLSLIHI